MRELRLPLTVLGKNLEGAGFWEGVEVRTANEDWLAGAAVVIQPALVEDNPRKLLKLLAALSARIPVIATAACGLPESPLVQIVSYGDVAALKQALTYVLSLKTAAHT
jgi:glycosyltransferase involved in cell wall biosynthesis